MRLLLSGIFTLLSIVFIVYVCASGVMDHWSIGIEHVLALCAILSFAAYFITQGAYDSLDDEN